MRAKLLPIAARSPSPAMASAREEFAEALGWIPVDESHPGLLRMSAAPMEHPRYRLAQGLTNPVRWCETLLALRGHGVESFIEVGPGRMLTGLVKRTLDGVEATTAQRLAGAGV